MRFRKFPPRLATGMQLRPAIKLRQLQYFLGVAETLHFSKAAEKLFVTQPTMSHQLAELESQIGLPLFDRAGKTVRLTEAGETFRGYARRCLEEINAGCNALAELEGLQRGVLRIGVTQSFIHKLMPPILGKFLDEHPGVGLSVLEMTAPQIEQGLVAGDLDLGIAFAPAVLEDTELEPILEERLMLVVRRDHRLAGQGCVPMAHLAGLPLTLLNREFSTRRLIEAYFLQVGLEPNVVCESNSIALMIGMARASSLAAIVPESSIDHDSDLSIVPITEPVPLRVSALMWSRHNYRTRAARTFAQLVRDRFLANASPAG